MDCFRQLPNHRAGVDAGFAVSTGREGFTIHSTTLIPKQEGQPQQALIVLERSAR
jgi:hypothetical protein